MSFRLEPDHDHGRPTRTAVLVVNLGTPDEPTAPAVRRYLAEFLTDPRVVEIPGWAWLPILHGIILRTRPARSASKYASIWTAEGSPLQVWTVRQAKLLLGALGERGHRVLVRHAMRYGSPSIASQLDALKAEGATRVLVLPMYPQYSAATTASVFDAVAHWGCRTRLLPELRFVQHFHDEPLYIEALAQRILRHWSENGQPERLVLSFHGMPKRTLNLGDPYFCECQKTARLLGERLGMAGERLVVTFQSRFGRAEWLQPYTEPTLRSLAKQGIKRVDVACPGFVADCLETLEEIAQEGRDAFLDAGGEVFHYVPCLNDDPRFIRALAQVAIQHLDGWPTLVAAPSEETLGARQARARALGAQA
ncbi:MAG TPA: ferrochelatase [Burkholderiaceae bacterium]|nr:ferrochelatase [Burkholderiaceae bacterium]